MANNRRAQAPKATKSKATSPYKAEKRIKNVNSPRKPKHASWGWGEDE